MRGLPLVSRYRADSKAFAFSNCSAASSVLPSLRRTPPSALYTAALGFSRERELVVMRRFFELSLLRQRIGEVVVGGRELRVDVDRLAELCRRLIRAALSGEDVSQAVVGLGGGSSRERLAVVGLGLAELHPPARTSRPG